jgi:ubiquitin carboxyl-terminal hydrolase 6/32
LIEALKEFFSHYSLQMPQEVYFLSTEKYRPTLFGLPLIVACSEATTFLDLYKSVWAQVSRLVSPLPPRDSSQNHATDW